MSPVQSPDSDSAAETKFISPASPARHRKPSAERYEISIHEASPNGAAVHRQASSQSHDRTALDSLYPVASLAERGRAALLDTSLLLFSYCGMLALFIALGGRLGFNKIDAGGHGGHSRFVLRPVFRAVHDLWRVYSGNDASRDSCGQLRRPCTHVPPNGLEGLWLSDFGRDLFPGVPMGALGRRQLCWHDRISQTYLTPTEIFTSPESSEEDSLPS